MKALHANTVTGLIAMATLAACSHVEDIDMDDHRADGFMDGGSGPHQEETGDGYDGARDVNLAHVVFADDVEAPERYSRPEPAGSFQLAGPEYYKHRGIQGFAKLQPSKANAFARRCAQASAIRFTAIMDDPPEEISELRRKSNWSGLFYSRNDDFSSSSSAPEGAHLSAFQTTLIKWNSQTDQDGSCHLPTQDLVARAGQACLEKAAANADAGRGREIKGCSAQMETQAETE